MTPKKTHITALAGLLATLALCASVRAESEVWKSWITPAEFRALTADCARNVDLFQRVWAVDPEAKFYGGTSRDLVWFVRGELAKASTEAELKAIVARLKERPIRIQEFVVGQSDVDVISRADLAAVDFDKTYLTRLEAISPDWFEPGTSYHNQEKLQGYVPVEKLMLGRDGFAKPKEIDYGDGVTEIYAARPTLHYDPRIVDTEMYQKRGNHPLLLALRYLRQVAVAYYRLYGNEYPDPSKLMALMDAKSIEGLRTILAGIRANPSVLSEFLSKPKFRERVDKALGKAFRSYTNPTAAKALLAQFGVDTLLEAYGDRIKPIHTLMYGKYRNETDLAAQRRQLGLGDGYVTSVESYAMARGLELRSAEGKSYFPIFHGTPSMENYRSIVFQGNVASENGSAGPGVYAVDARSIEFAKTWKRWKEDAEPLVVGLHIDPKAKIVDLTTPEGDAAFRKFMQLRGGLEWRFDGGPATPDASQAEMGRLKGGGLPPFTPPQNEYAAFADFVGADVLRYPYRETNAYVVNNGTVIQGQEGVTVPLLSLEQLRHDLESHGFDRDRFLKFAALDRSLLAHADFLLAGLPAAQSLRLTLDAMESDPQMIAKLGPSLLANGVWQREPEAYARLVKLLAGEKDNAAAHLKTIDGHLPGLPPETHRAVVQALLGTNDVPWIIAGLAERMRSGDAADEARAEMLAFLRSGLSGVDTAIADCFGRHPELYPMSLDVVEALVNRPQSHALLAKKILSDPYWARHPKGAELVERLVREGHCDKQLMENIFSAPDWRRNPGFPTLVETYLERGKSRRIEHGPGTLESMMREGLSNVREFSVMMESARREGIQLWMAGDGVARFARYTLGFLDTEAGRSGRDPDRLDFDFTNIYPAAHKIEFFAAGDDAAIDRFRQDINRKYPFIFGEKGTLETVTVREGRPVLDRNDRFSGTLLDLTAGDGKPLVVTATPGEAPFTDAQRTGVLAWPGLPPGTAPKDGLVPVLDFLMNAFRFGLTVPETDLLKLRGAVHEAQPSREAMAQWAVDTVRRLDEIADFEYAFHVLDETGLKKKLLGLEVSPYFDERVKHDFLRREPVPARAVGLGGGRTARELGIDGLDVETTHFNVWEAYAAANDQRLNGFMKEGPLGKGFYLVKVYKGGPGFTMKFRLSPDARQGTDFLVSGNDVVVRNRNALTAVYNGGRNPGQPELHTRSVTGPFVPWGRMERWAVTDRIRPLIVPISEHHGDAARLRCVLMLGRLDR